MASLVTELKLPATLRLADVTPFLGVMSSAIDEASQQGQALVLDAQNLQDFDSSALSVLLECRRQVQRRGGKVSIAHLPERLLALATLYGLMEIVSCNASEVAAVPDNEK